MKLRFLLLSSLCLCGIAARSLAAESYTFTTIAGLAGVSGSADGTNSDARFLFPADIAVDNNGVLYVADLSNQTIRKIVPMGTNWVVTTIAGMAGVLGYADGTNSDARFNRPNGIIADGAGNVFVGDTYNAVVRELTPVETNWVVITIAGNPGVLGGADGTGTNAEFWSPRGVAVDQNGRLYVVDSGNFTIRGIVPLGTNGVVSTLAGTAQNFGFLDGTNEFAQFNTPFDLALTHAGVLYVTDFANDAIRQVAPQGTNWVTTTIAGFSGSPGTNDGSGAVAMFNSPNGIAVDNATNLYIADQSNHTIRKMVPNGTNWMVSTIAGTPGQLGTNDGTGSLAKFNKPWGIAVHRDGTLFVVDSRNHTIRKGIPPGGPIPTLQISRVGAAVVFSWPVGATNYTLETASSVRPGGTWTTVTNAVVISGSSRYVTNVPSASAAFFRLHGY
jgi:secreted PhoX family phosphatase